MEWIKRVSEQLDKQLPFVVYRKPGRKKIRALFQRDERLHAVGDFTEQGFVMAPFVPGEYPTILIRPDQVLEATFSHKKTRLPFEITTDPNGDKGKQEYLRMAERAIEELQSGSLQKVVLSRRRTLTLSPDPLAVYQLLLNQFPDAFGYLFYHPQIGLWMGASPETLIRYSTEQFETVSLAGTIKMEGASVPKWGEKEIREQEYVTNYIREVLETRAVELEVMGPETVRAGNLYHLKSTITGVNPAASFQELIRVLHPTPAVCGIPLKKARNFLLEQEDYPRAYYTGYLGELNMGPQKSSQLYVNLRCMCFEKEHVHIYIGGGLVKGSDPEKEWQETVYKSTAMGHLIMNSVDKLG